MSNSKLISATYPAYSGNYTKGRNGKKIEMIAIHHMAGVLTAQQCGAIWQKAGRNGSSNYGIGNSGEIALYVDEKNASWCNSNFDSNCRSVTIEVSNSSTGGNWEVGDKALNSLIQLVADIAKRNKLGTLVKGKNVVWHSMYVATACPGPYLMSKLDYIIAEANRINGSNVPTPAPSSTNNSFFGGEEYFGPGDVHENIGKIASFMYKTFPAYTSKKALGNVYGPYIMASIKEFQRRTGLEPDGYTGPLTLAKLEQYGFKY